MPDSKSLMIQDARIIFRNFAGREREYNSEGDRNFSVVLEPSLAKKLIDEGWRVKQLKPREDEEEGDYHLKVNLNYKKGRPPRCVVITSKSHTELGMDEIALLDAADIKQVDVMINGWWSDMAGGGYSGFLKSIFVTLNEDELELMYASLLQDQNQTPEIDTRTPSFENEENE